VHAIAAICVFSEVPERTAVHRRLDRTLDEAERRLQQWGDWTRDHSETGFPKRWVTAKIGEGGITAGSPRPPTVLPEEVALVDKIIARLTPRWRKFAQINWQFAHEPRELRARRARCSEATLKSNANAIRLAVHIGLNL
jgi:hypothetical protein